MLLKYKRPSNTRSNLTLHIKNKKTTNSGASSPQATYMDWETAAGRRILVPTFADRGESRGQRDWPSRPLISAL
jgi:hypothetical protein